MSPAEFKFHFHFELILLAIFLGLVAAFTSDQTTARIAVSLGIWSGLGMAVGLFVERRNRKRYEERP